MKKTQLAGPFTYRKAILAAVCSYVLLTSGAVSTCLAEEVEFYTNGEKWVVHINPGPKTVKQSNIQQTQFISAQEAAPAESQSAESQSAESQPTEEAIPTAEAVPSPESTTQPPPPLMTEGEAVPVTAPIDCPPAMASRYLEVYASIPFFRSEYVANPSYRHEATMEILFGQLRPTVVHKYQPRAADYVTPDINYVQPYSFYRHGRRYNYNFWYPGPSIRQYYRRY